MFSKPQCSWCQGFPECPWLVQPQWEATLVGDFGCSCIWAFFAASLLLQGNKAGLRISRSSCGLSLRNASANLPQGMVPSTTSYEFTHPFTHLSTHPSIYSFKRCLLSCILRVCTRLWVQSLHPEEGDRQLAQKTMVGGITRLPPNAHQERTYAGLMGSPGMGGQEGFLGTEIISVNYVLPWVL